MPYLKVYQDWDILKENTSSNNTMKLEKKVKLSHIQKFGAQLQEARIRKRMSILDISNLLGISPRTVTMYENESEVPDTDMIKKIETILEF